ncbi:MAG: hypothetical protein ABI806_20455 [Candidatus Solibacter sp.]
MRDKSHRDTGLRLAQELEDARRGHIASKEEFDAIIREVPSGLPPPDGVFRLEQSGKVSRRAMEVYYTALRRYSDFLLRDIMPEDPEA